MKIFDNIGCEFSYDINTDSFILLSALPGYSSLSIEDSGFTIPYLARNINNKNIDYELGTGLLEKIGNKLILKNRKVSVSSNNNSIVNFSKEGNKQFYIFVHSVNFDRAFNNLFIKNEDFSIEPKKSVYIVDVSKGYVIGSLPDPTECDAVEIEFKTVGDSGSLSIRYNSFDLILNNNSYTKLVSTGKEWIELKDNTNLVRSLELDSDQTFSILSEPSGNDRSLQFNNNGSFDGSSVFQGNNNKILFGSSSESSAKHIIPSSGSYDFIVNKSQDGSDFIVYGTGNAPGYPSHNLYFTNDGKLGINMPSGINSTSLVKPLTILHVFNTLCREGIRLENRTNCHPANITLYDNPFSARPDGSGIAKIVFAGKNQSYNKIDYAQIEAKAKSSSSSQGQLDIIVSDGSSSITTLSSSSTRTTLATNNSTVDLNNNAVSISGSSISLNGANAAINATNTTISGIASISNSLRLPYINSSNVLLSINQNKEIIATTGFKIPGLSTTQESLLTVNADGTVVANSPKDSFWPYENNQERIGGKDVIWSRYPYRSANVCLNKTTRELQIDSATLEEFSVGDQIAILDISNYTTIYRYITNITLTNDIITGLLIDQDILITNNNANLRVYSVSKGGVLTNTLYTSGIVSDSTANIISSRPKTNTVFNTNKKNIDFTVFGSEDVPALNILTNVAVSKSLAGTYTKYATDSNLPPSVAKIDSNGAGATNSTFNNTANFKDAADSIWSGKVSIVGNNGRSSYYGTYDQNGNVYEWVEDDNKQLSNSSQQYVCGGSWRTLENNGLRGYIPTPRYSGLDDVGFRICSKAGYSNELEERLSLSFSRVDNAGNPPDSGYLYTESWTNRFSDTNDQPEPVSKNGLGAVSYPYRISNFEITNTQYASFLNVVATGLGAINRLYKEAMSTGSVGGIARSGNGTSSPYTYHVKSNMANMPAVFIDYVSAIRYINWISNGAPTGTNINLASVTEIGAYIIEAGDGGSDSITKNRDQNYWLPTLNEWHKAAYYKPTSDEQETNLTAVTIRKDSPFEYSQNEPFVSGSGNIASLSVDGLLYTDYLKINNFNIVDSDLKSYSSVIDPKESIVAVSGSTYFINKSGDITSRVQFKPDITILSQPILLTTGNLSSATSANGFLISHTGISYINGGETVQGGLFPGPDGGYLFKDPEGSTIISSSGNLSTAALETENGKEYLAQLNNTNQYEVIHNDLNATLGSSDWFTVGKIDSSLDIGGVAELVSIKKTREDLGAVLYTDRILIGPVLEGYSGSLLTHNGNKPAYWQTNEFFKAPGASWYRYPRRAIEFIKDSDNGDIRLLKFVSLDVSKGGTGPIDVQTIEKEFAINETIAIYNQSREVVYVKVSNIGLLDSRDNTVNNSFFLDTNTLQIAVCPSIPESFVAGSVLNLGETDPDSGRYIGYAFSVQKGAYLDMSIEPNATSKFSCTEENTDNSEYAFKPATSNSISIRPGVYTAFNKIAEDIDFVIYGHRKTLFTRYESALFDQDIHGIPTGLSPAFRVHAKIDNSCIGSVESGVIRNTIGETNLTATGILPDLNPKITINTHEPYVISSLVGIKKGVLSPATTEEENLKLEEKYGTIIPNTGVLISGIRDISNYADLTVNGSTYTDTLITKDVVLGPVWSGEIPVPYELSLTQKIYAPNYPLTINSIGQIVSLIPPPAPEAPSEPINLLAEANNSAVVLTWDSPLDDGGEDILGYVVEFSADNGTNWIVSDQIDDQTLLPIIADKNTTRVIYSPDIANNISYIFRVSAYNRVGKGKISSASAAVTPSTSLSPKSPSNFRITSGENEFGTRSSTNLTLSWDPVASIPPDTILQGYIIEKWIYNTNNITDLKLATWVPLQNSPASANSVSIQTFGIDPEPLIYFSIRAQASDGSESVRMIYASLGSSPDPRPLSSKPKQTVDNQYNFGSVVFVGSCSE